MASLQKVILTSALLGSPGLCLAQSAHIEVVKVFPGQNGPNPPDAPQLSADMMGGVGLTHLVGFWNGGVSIRSKADGKEVAPYQTQREFWAAAFTNAGGALIGKPYDPRIFFDPLTKRWFAVANTWIGTISSHILIGVSSDADPRHPWKAVDLETRGPVDNSKLGLDRNGLYTTEMMGQRPDAPPLGAVLVIPKADLLWKADSKPSLAHLNRLEIPMRAPLSDRRYDGIEGLIPAFDVNPKKQPSDPEIYVNRFRKVVDGETMLQVRRVVWTSPTIATLSEAAEIGLGVAYPVMPTSRGVQPALPEGLNTPGLNAGEGRLVNVALHAGSAWVTAATQVNNRAGAFWAQIDLGSMKLVQQGTLGDTDADVLFPSVNVDARGNLGIVAIRTSASQGASTYATGRLQADPLNTLRPLVRIVEGKYTYLTKATDLTKPNQGAQNSDYAGMVVDPSDATLFWSYQLAATNNCMPKEERGGAYGTNWVAFRVKKPGKP